MHLGQRGSPQRLGIKIHHFGAALTKLLFQNGLNPIKSECRDTILKSGQLTHPSRRKDVRTR
jgi:hypothetical protein